MIVYSSSPPLQRPLSQMRLCLVMSMASIFPESRGWSCKKAPETSYKHGFKLKCISSHGGG